MPWFANWGQLIQIGLQIIGLVGVPFVLTAVVGLVQRLRSGSLDWWVLGTLFTVGVVLISVSSSQQQDLLSSPKAVQPSAGRHLTEEQKTALIASLQRQEPRSIEVVSPEYPGTEAGRYAADFIAVFVEAGWTVKREVLRTDLSPGWPTFFFQQGDEIAETLARQLKEIDKRLYAEGVQYSNPFRLAIKPLPATD